MSYLLNKKARRNKVIRYAALLALAAILVFAGAFSKLSFVSHAVFRPALYFINGAGTKISSLASYFSSKKSLYMENENLKWKLYQQEAKMANYDSVMDENLKLKEILLRGGERGDLMLANILSKPDQSLYDTFIVDVGSRHGISSRQRVFALGNIPIGRVAEVYYNSAKVVLYSSPGEETGVVISGSDVFVQAVGRGGGNFEIVLPRDFILEKGAEIVLPGNFPYVLGVVGTVLSDPRDSYLKALLKSPVNIFELKFVEVEVEK